MKGFSIVWAQALVAGLLTVFVGSAAAQQAYPSKTIRITVPTAAGGSTSNIARVIAQKLTEAWGQQVIVENRPGGNSVIGTEYVARSAPDGYTLLVPSTTHVTLPLLIPGLSFDAIKDFAPVAALAQNKSILVVHPSVPARNLQEFIALAKARPGQLNYATAGTGSSNHLGVEAFCRMVGIKMQVIPYKGGSQALADVIGGLVELSFQTPVSVLPHIRSGKLRPIAITGETRLPALPQIPTFGETGLPGFDHKSWQGMFAPAGTPKAVIDKLAAEIARILAMSDVKEKLDAQGVEPYYLNPGQFAAMLKSETAKFAEIIRIANIKISN